MSKTLKVNTTNLNQHKQSQIAVSSLEGGEQQPPSSHTYLASPTSGAHSHKRKTTDQFQKAQLPSKNIANASRNQASLAPINQQAKTMQSDEKFRQVGSKHVQLRQIAESKQQERQKEWRCFFRQIRPQGNNLGASNGFKQGSGNTNQSKLQREQSNQGLQSTSQQRFHQARSPQSRNNPSQSQSMPSQAHQSPQGNKKSSHTHQMSSSGVVFHSNAGRNHSNQHLDAIRRGDHHGLGGKTNRRHQSINLLQGVGDLYDQVKKMTDEEIEGMLKSGTLNFDSLDESLAQREETRNVIHAIKLRKTKMGYHTDFYNLLEQVNDRIIMYKSLFLDKQPKFIKGHGQWHSHKVTEKELVERKMKAQEEEKRQKHLQHQDQAKKRKEFYEQLSKKPNKKFKVTLDNRKGAVIMSTNDVVGQGGVHKLLDYNSKSKNGQPNSIIKKDQLKGISLKDNAEGRAYRQSVIVHSMSLNELELIKAEYDKELARKEKLYAQKSFKIKISTLQSSSGGQDSMSVTARNTTTNQLALENQQSSFEGRNTFQSGANNPNNITQSFVNTSMSLHNEIVLRNDISYLSNLKNSSSLPYLKHIQIQPEDKDPLKQYISQKIQQQAQKYQQSKFASVKRSEPVKADQELIKIQTESGNNDRSRIAEVQEVQAKQNGSLDQSKSTAVLSNSNFISFKDQAGDEESTLHIIEDEDVLRKLRKEQRKRLRLIKLGEQKFLKLNQKSQVKTMFGAEVQASERKSNTRDHTVQLRSILMWRYK